jgi:hypothetical protein
LLDAAPDGVISRCKVLASRWQRGLANFSAMTMIDPVPALRDLCGGAVALPGDDGYDAARSGFNLALDPRPAAVAYPADPRRDRRDRSSGSGGRPPRRFPVHRPQRRPAD